MRVISNTRLFFPHYPGKMCDISNDWRRRQIEQRMISIPASSHDPGESPTPPRARENTTIPRQTSGGKYLTAVISHPINARCRPLPLPFLPHRPAARPASARRGLPPRPVGSPASRGGGARVQRGAGGTGGGTDGRWRRPASTGRGRQGTSPRQGGRPGGHVAPGRADVHRGTRARHGGTPAAAWSARGSVSALPPHWRRSRHLPGAARAAPSHWRRQPPHPTALRAPPQAPGGHPTGPAPSLPFGSDGARRVPRSA